MENTGGGILVITEGLFGMAGDLGKLDEIVAIKRTLTSACSWMMHTDSEPWDLMEPEQVTISV